MPQSLFYDDCSSFHRWKRHIDAHRGLPGMHSPPPKSQWRVEKGAFKCSERYYSSADSIESVKFFVPANSRPQLTFNADWNLGRNSLTAIDDYLVVSVSTNRSWVRLRDYRGLSQWKKRNFTLPKASPGGENYSLMFILNTHAGNSVAGWCRIDRISVFLP
jgi:hypothetical protein